MMRLLLGLLLLLAHAAMAADQPKDPPGIVTMSPDAQRGVKLATAPAHQQRIVQTLQVPGTAMFDERRVAHLHPFGQGRVITLNVGLGDAVHVGQRLATLDFADLTDARNGLAAAQAALRQARADAAVADAALHRGTALQRDGSLSQADVERRRGEAARAQAAVDTAQAQVTMYQTRAQRLDPTGTGSDGGIVTPIDGVVAAINLTPGQVVDASMDAFTVADLSKMLVVATVPENALSLIHQGDTATIKASAYPNQDFHGHLLSLGAEVDPRTNTIPARLQIDNPDLSLKAGMYVTLEVRADLGRDGVVVPAAAVQMLNDKAIAFTPLDNGRFQRLDLTLGVQQPDWVELRSGVQPNQLVVTAGSFQLKALMQSDLLGSTD